jgi:hypothetical protein
VFNDVVGKESYRGEQLGDVVLRMAKLLPDVHRELHRVTVLGDVVAVELSIQGTFLGPLLTPAGIVQPTGAKIDVPTADLWYLRDGKIETFITRQSRCRSRPRSFRPRPADPRALTTPLGACGNSPDRHLPLCGGAAGSCTVTRSPPAARGVRVRVPSCAWVMLLTMARPRPTPAWSVRTRPVPR